MMPDDKIDVGNVNAPGRTERAFALPYRRKD